MSNEKGSACIETDVVDHRVYLKFSNEVTGANSSVLLELDDALWLAGALIEQVRDAQKEEKDSTKVVPKND